MLSAAAYGDSQDVSALDVPAWCRVVGRRSSAGRTQTPSGLAFGVEAWAMAASTPEVPLKETRFKAAKKGGEKGVWASRSRILALVFQTIFCGDGNESVFRRFLFALQARKWRS